VIWGTVARTDLKGPIIVNYWSWNNQESWAAMLNPLPWVRLLANEMRWERIGMRHRCEPDGEAFVRRLIEERGVAAIPPASFYEHEEHARGLVRFAFCKTVETIRAAAERLAGDSR